MQIPRFVISIIDRLKEAGFEAFIVGGAVRDMSLGLPIKDWDVATSASPQEIQEVFQGIKHFYLKHDTVTLVHNGRHFDVTSYRGRTPAGCSLESDLGHRDFTINAMAYDLKSDAILDPYGGRRDISRRRIRAVGNPDDRFMEDPLRLLRAIRMASELRFPIEEKTFNAIRKMSQGLKSVAPERIREEFMAILVTKKASEGIQKMRITGLLQCFLPELMEGYRKKQDREQPFTIFKHILETVDLIEPDPIMRLAALLHDIGKPRVRKRVNGHFQFSGHEEASAQLAECIMKRLRFSQKNMGQVRKFIAFHTIGYHPDRSDGAVRRLIRQVGVEDVNHLIALRRADLLAKGTRDRQLDHIHELEVRVKEIMKTPFPMKTRELDLDGQKVMDLLGLSQGPEVGQILDELMEMVLDRPELNTESRLISIMKSMKRNQRI